MNIPDTFYCPITQEIMKDPWTDSDGNTFEKNEIFKWVNEHGTSPITRNPISITSLVPNRALKDMIESYFKPHLPNISIKTDSGKIKNKFQKMQKNIILLADTSGSMGVDCDNNNSSEKMGFSRLDLVKHTMNTIIDSLDDTDNVSIIKFNSDATPLTRFINLTTQNKQVLKSIVDDLRPDGGTNIWDALQTSLELSRTISHDSNIDILLFTDGESNEDPPRGIIPTLQSYLNLSNLNVSIHTFGFGNDINSRLLYDISIQKNGLFGFIPDSTMIGSVFINALSFMCSSKQNLSEFDEGVKLKLIDALNNVTKKHLSEFNNFVQYLNNLDEKTEFVNDLILDCIDTGDENLGQISKAIEPKYYDKWGKHYILSILSAYNNNLCLNFKDKGVQHFKSTEFEQIQNHIENIFINLPPPKPSNKYHSSPISSQAFSQTFYNVSGGCFTGDTLINIGNNVVRIDSICKDDEVFTPYGYAKVKCVIRFKYTGYLMKHNFTKITPFHPVYFNSMKWFFPEYSTSFERIYVTDEYVYDFILDKFHIIELDGIFAVTLNHNFSDPIVHHEYFGGHIINDLIKIDGWDNGYIILDNYTFIRDDDNKVCGIEKIKN
jgi:hypothetical protein